MLSSMTTLTNSIGRYYDASWSQGAGLKATCKQLEVEVNIIFPLKIGEGCDQLISSGMIIKTLGVYGGIKTDINTIPSRSVSYSTMWRLGISQSRSIGH